MVALRPDQPAAWRGLATVLQASGDETTLEAWNGLLAADGADIEAHDALAALYAARGEPAMAAVHARALAEGPTSGPAAWTRLARLLEEAGDPEGAIGAWCAVVAGDPADLPAHERLSALYAGQGRPQDALAHLRAVAEAASTAEAWADLARALQALGRPEEAIEAWRGVLRARDADVEALDNLGRLLTEAGRPSEAVPYLRALAEAVPTSARFWKRLAKAQRTAGDREAALDSWRRLAAVPGSELDGRSGLGEAFSELGRHAEAAEAFRAAADADPSAKQPARRLAQALKAAGDEEGALGAWRRLLSVPGAEVEAHAELAGLLFEAGRHAEAVVHLRVTAEHDGRLKPWKRLAQSSKLAGDAQGAVAAWRKVLDIGGAEAEAHRNLASLLHGLGLGQEALPHFEAAAEAEPDQSAVWVRLAQVRQELGDRDGAVEALRRASAAAPDERAVHEALAALLNELDRRDEALVHLRRIAELSPSEPKPWRRLSNAARTAGNDDLAVEALRRMAAIPGSEAEAEGGLGALCLELRRYPEALPYLQAAVGRDGADAQAWARLGRAADGAGDPELAVQAWTRAVELSPADRAMREGLIGVLSAQRRDKEALAHSRILAEGAPEDLKLWKRLALAARAAQERDLSIEAWRQVLRIGGADLEAHGHLGDLLFETRRPAEAAPHLKITAEAQPERLKPWKRLADALEGLGDLAGAAEALEAVLKIGDDPEVRGRRADLLLRGGRAKEAVVELQALTKAFSKEPRWWDRLARAQTQAKDADAAAAAWRKVIALDRDNRAARIELAQLFLDRGQPEAAAPHLRWAAERAPDDLKVQRRLARALQALGDAEAAIATWKHVIGVEPEDAEANPALATLLDGLGRTKEALGFHRAVAFASGDLKAIRRFGRTAQDRGDLEESKAAWMRVLSAAPGDPEAHQQLSNLFQALGDEEEAAFHLQRLAQAKGSDERTWRRAAKAFARLGKTDEAAAAWQRVFETAPSERDLHAALAELFEASETPAKAEPHLRWLIARGEGEPAAAWMRLARTLSRSGDEVGEIAAWNEVLALRPDDSDAHNRLASLHKQRGDLQAAAAHLRALAERDPKQAKPWRRLANHLGEAGDAEGEVEVWRTVLSINPKDREGQARLAELLTDLYLPAQALPHLQAIAQQSPDVAKHWQRVARAVQKSQGPQEALAAWERVLRLRPDDLEAHENMVRLLDQLGRGEEATPHLRLLAEAGPRRLELWRRLAPLDQGVEAEIAWWKRVLALTPDDRALLERLSLFLYGLGRKAEALPYFRDLTRLAPEDPLVWRRLAQCLEDLGDDAGAREARGVMAMAAGDVAA